MSSGPHILEVILEKSTLRKAAPIRLAAFPLSGSVALGPSQHRIAWASSFLDAVMAPAQAFGEGWWLSPV